MAAIFTAVRIARNADRCNSHGTRAVCPSVRHVPVFCGTNEDTIMRFSASGRTIILVSGKVKFIRIFAGVTLQRWR